ncbi:MAG: restriction endonuclease subunit R, partial [Ruthenibacterium sp.]
MEQIASREALQTGASMQKDTSANYGPETKIVANRGVKYDLVGKLEEGTNLTRKDSIAILTGIGKSVFEQFKDNPEEFISKAITLINDEKATAIIQHITYDMLDEHYDTDVFTEPTIKGKL